MWTDLDQNVTEPLFLEIERDGRREDAIIERDQPVHVGGDERKVVEVVEELHSRLFVFVGQ